jgi:hypothetical protein
VTTPSHDQPPRPSKPRAGTAPGASTETFGPPSQASLVPTWNRHLRALAILLPLVAGFVCSFLDLSVLLLAWLPFTLGVASAALLRSWWAVVLTPVALSLGTVFGLAAAGSRPGDLSDPAFVASLAAFVLLTLLPATMGAAVGAPLGKEIERNAGPLFASHHRRTRQLRAP